MSIILFWFENSVFPFERYRVFNSVLPCRCKSCSDQHSSEFFQWLHLHLNNNLMCLFLSLSKNTFSVVSNGWLWMLTWEGYRNEVHDSCPLCSLPFFSMFSSFWLNFHFSMAPPFFPPSSLFTFLLWPYTGSSQSESLSFQVQHRWW